MKAHTLLAAAAIMAGPDYYQPDETLTPSPWERRTTCKGSGTGSTGLNIKKSRAKAKAARKARRKHRSGARP